MALPFRGLLTFVRARGWGAFLASDPILFGKKALFPSRKSLETPFPRRNVVQNEPSRRPFQDPVLDPPGSKIWPFLPFWSGLGLQEAVSLVRLRGAWDHPLFVGCRGLGAQNGPNCRLITSACSQSAK